MKLVVTEKHDAAQKIANLLGANKPTADKVYSTPVYRFTVNGEEWVTIGLRGHIIEYDFVESLLYKKRGGWMGLARTGELVDADIPKELPQPPFKKRKPFTEDGVELSKWKMEALPYLVYAPIEHVPAEKEIIRSLKNLAKKADSVVIATDFDREGELIGSDALDCVMEVNPTLPVSRARYSAFTKEEITEAFNNLVELDYDLAYAGASRREIDLIWGAVLTRYLTLVKFAGYGNTRSAGRVQTPTLALIIARERERLAFVPEDYWVIKGLFGNAEGTCSLEGVRAIEAFEASHATARFKSQKEADAVLAHVQDCTTARVGAITKKMRTVAPPVPFNTTSLMAAASAEGISPSRTMNIAESLYMRGLISYPRVDNTVYPASLDLADVVKRISKNPAYEPYCKQLLAQKKLTATRGKKETTDHPPIYPTACATPDMLSPADYKLYNLIARRFLATLSDACKLEGSKMILEVGEEQFATKGDVVVQPGFRAIYPYGLKKDEILPALNEGDIIAFNGATCTKKQTEPPARYSQGKLIQEMEKLGLGTKSTRHSIIDRLYAVKYIQNDPIEPSQLGMAVCDALDQFAPHITHPEMTAKLEKEMSSITQGAISKQDVVTNSRDLLSQQLSELMPHSEEVAEALKGAVAADAYVGVCPKCGKDLQRIVSPKTRGMFIGCSGYPECDTTYPIPSGKIESVSETCPACGLPQLKVTPFRSKPYTVCIDPNCSTNYEPNVDVGVCAVCAEAGREGHLIAQRNPRTLKRFIRCDHYDECGVSYPLPAQGKMSATGGACPDCGTWQVTIASSRGPWTLCPNPACPSKEKKATRAAAKKSSRATKRTGTKRKSTTSKRAAKTE